MFGKPTVFVLGAGASVEVGMPAGITLLEQISRRLIDLAAQGSQTIGELALSQAIIASGVPMGDFQQTLTYMGQALKHAPSIDHFLHVRSDNPTIVKIGKLAIAQLLLEAEAQSALKSIQNTFHDETKVGRSWFASLFKLLNSGVKRTEIANIFQNVSFISFNYDRCLHQYMREALIQYYGLNSDEASYITRRLKVAYPYGSLGNMVWGTEKKTNTIVEYGDVSGRMLNHVAEQIYTFDESREDQSVHEEIGQALYTSYRIVFLGFGFYPQNMRLLFERSGFDFDEVFATCLGFSTQKQLELERTFYNGLGTQSRTVNCTAETCAKFFNTFDGMLNA